MRTHLLLLALVESVWLAHADVPVSVRRASVDEISQDAIQSAFQVLRRDYIRREDLTFDQLNRAALQGLLERLDFGAELVRADSGGERPGKPNSMADLLAKKIGYLRPQSFAEGVVPLLEGQLKELVSKGASHLILDLRCDTAPAELEVAAGLAELFLPKGEVLFKLRRLGGGDAQLMLSRREPVWAQPLLVLVDRESCNVAETLAAVLKQKKRAMLVGSETRGATVRYEEVPLDAGWRLRFASAEVLLADDHSVFKKGISPDFIVNMDLKAKAEVFGSVGLKPVEHFVFEQARERFNEKALVAGKNPELDDYISRSAGRIMPYDRPPPRDTVLQRAVDLIQSNAFVK